MTIGHINILFILLSIISIKLSFSSTTIRLFYQENPIQKEFVMDRTVFGSFELNRNQFDSLIDLYQFDRTPSKYTIDYLIKICRIFQKDTGVSSVEEIDKRLLNLWKSILLSRVKKTTCNSYLRQFRALIKFAYDEGIIKAYPYTGFSFVREGEPEYKLISNATTTQAISYLSSEENTLSPGWFWIIVIRTFYYTGMRRRQLAGLTFKDLDLKQQTILLSSDHSKTLKQWTIPINHELIPDLYFLKARNHEIFGHEDKDIASQQVFNITYFNQKYTGNFLTINQISGFFRNLSKKIGAKCSPHRFRHKIATELTNNQTNIKVVQELLGHRDVKTTLGYVHSDMTQMRKAVETTSSILREI